MGFNLKVFFEDLEEILNSKNFFTKLQRLRKVIQKGHIYARECGHLRGK
jgi:hypothetical protein